jgi:hypothetical protein
MADDKQPRLKNEEAEQADLEVEEKDADKVQGGLRGLKQDEADIRANTPRQQGRF